MPLVPLLEHKNAVFVLEKPENEGFKPQKRTKTSILCSKCLKTGVSDPKSAQKPRFCARNARKQGFRSLKAHKNPDFVLGKVDRRAWVQQQANAKKHREEERVLRATKKKHREEEMRTNLFIFEVGQVKAVLGVTRRCFCYDKE